MSGLPEPVQRVQEGDTVEVLGCQFKRDGCTGPHGRSHCVFRARHRRSAHCCFVATPCFRPVVGACSKAHLRKCTTRSVGWRPCPANTRVCCTHEYTLSNLRFALTVEPDNAALQGLCRALPRSARSGTFRHCRVPFSWSARSIPFFEPTCRALHKALADTNPPTSDDPVAVLTALRAWKDVF